MSQQSNQDHLLHLTVQLLQKIQTQDLIAAWQLSEEIVKIQPDHPTVKSFRALLKEDVEFRKKQNASTVGNKDDEDEVEPSDEEWEDDDDDDEEEEEVEDDDDDDDNDSSAAKTSVEMKLRARMAALAVATNQQQDKPVHQVLQEEFGLKPNTKSASATTGRTSTSARSNSSTARRRTGSNTSAKRTSSNTKKKITPVSGSLVKKPLLPSTSQNIPIPNPPPPQPKSVLRQTSNNDDEDSDEDIRAMEQAAKAEVERRLATMKK